MPPTRKRRCPAPKAIPTLCTDMVMCLFKIAPCDTRRAMRLVCREWDYVCTKYRAKPFECCDTPVQFKSYRFCKRIPKDRFPTFAAFICQRKNMEEINMVMLSASTHGLVDTVTQSITAGARVSTWDNFALYMACSLGHFRVIKVLIAAGADVHARYDYPLRQASKRGDLEIVKYLLSVGANVSDEALSCASSRGHEKVVKVLLTAGQS